MAGIDELKRQDDIALMEPAHHLQRRHPPITDLHHASRFDGTEVALIILPMTG